MIPEVRIGSRDASTTDTGGHVRPLTGLHAWYPGRRMNLGLVLLPLRVLLGLMLLGAGIGKLTDPVYFDGGQRGSLMRWLSELHPWGVAAPLLDFATAHPVGSGLAVAFVQIAVGALAIVGLWQRVCAAVGMLLAAALLVTVGWRDVPVYDAPDMLYLAAWSPLVIAGAPLFSVDSWLASEAWRRFQPRPGLWQLRRRVMLRGAPLVALVVGLTLLLGAALGASTRNQRDFPTTPMPKQSPAPSSSPSGSPHGSPYPSGGPTAGQPGGAGDAPRHRSTRPQQSSPSPTVPQRDTGPRTPDGARTGQPDTPSGETGPQGPQQGQVEQPPTRSEQQPPVRQPDQQPQQNSPGDSPGGPAGGSGGADGGSGSGSGSEEQQDSGRDGPLGGILGGGLGDNGLLGTGDGSPAGRNLIA